MAEKVRDLRSALALLEQMPDQLIETEVEVDPMAELAGVYRYVGAGGTVKRPTKEGPAMIFNRIKGHPDARVAIGLLASRKRVAALLDTQPENLGKMLCKSVENPIPPVDLEGEHRVSRWCIRQQIRILTSISWFLRQRTHRMMRARISHLACATPHTRILEFTM